MVSPRSGERLAADKTEFPVRAVLTNGEIDGDGEVFVTIRFGEQDVFSGFVDAVDVEPMLAAHHEEVAASLRTLDDVEKFLEE